MFCPKCGTQVPDDATFCGVCGTKVNNANAAGEPVQPPINFAPPAGSGPAAQTLPMKWYKFLIYCALWLGGVFDILMSIPYFSGSVYESSGVSAELVYLVFPSLKTLNILYALVLIALGALSIYTRFRLAAYAKNGPRLVNILYGANAAASLLYVIINGSVIDDFSTLPTSIIAAIGSVVIILLNRTYFNKRADMFVN